MNSPVEQTNIPGPLPSRHRRIMIFAGAAMLLLFAAGLYLALRPLPANDVTWLTPAQFAQASSAGPWTRVKYRVKALLGPALKYLRPPRPNIITRVTMLGLSAEVAGLEPQKPASATNSDGVKVWELSASELKNMQQWLPALPGVAMPNAGSAVGFNIGATHRKEGSMVTASGGQGHLTIYEPLLPGGRFVPAGLSCDATAKYAAGSINLLLGLTSTEPAPAPPGGSGSLRTNFTFACRVQIENAGGLLIAKRATDNSSGTNYWFLISPTAVDARGNPIKR